jgi:hypothetical protein
VVLLATMACGAGAPDPIVGRWANDRGKAGRVQVEAGAEVRQVGRHQAGEVARPQPQLAEPAAPPPRRVQDAARRQQPSVERAQHREEDRGGVEHGRDPAQVAAADRAVDVEGDRAMLALLEGMPAPQGPHAGVEVGLLARIGEQMLGQDRREVLEGAGHRELRPRRQIAAADVE